MKFTVWYSTESMADYIIDHTDLRHHECAKRKLLESDASKPRFFHSVPDHLGKRAYRNRRERQLAYFHNRSIDVPKETMSPLSATVEVDTSLVADYLRRVGQVPSVGPLLPSRPKTVLYSANASFRGDPYPGALAAIDYMLCRNGPTFEDRDRNLVMVWGRPEVADGHLAIEGEASIDDFCVRVRNSEQHNLLPLHYADVRAKHQIPRYYMQTRYGSTYSKSKEIRVYSYFCDAILFKDGALWREG